jgi:hypothetical protein
MRPVAGFFLFLFDYRPCVGHATVCATPDCVHRVTVLCLCCRPCRLYATTLVCLVYAVPHCSTRFYCAVLCVYCAVYVYLCHAGGGGW